MRLGRFTLGLALLGLLLYPLQAASAPVPQAAVNDLAATTPGWTLAGGQKQAYLGTWRPAGDINADGYDDLVVGIPNLDIGSADVGRVLVFYGSLDGYAAAADWSADGAAAGDYFGVSVAGAGDVNGDGYDDVLVGAHGVDASDVDTNVGRVTLYYGSRQGLALSPGWTFTGTQASENLGYRVAGGEDLDGDGYDDIAVGAVNYDNGETNEGRVLVFFGDASGPAAAPDWSAESNQASSNFGVGLSLLPDVNGNGCGELMVGAPMYDNGISDEGAAFVWYGSTSGLGDPGTPANADWMADSNQATRFFGETLGSPGDVDDDGFAEVIISSREYSGGQEYEGAAFVWEGSASGINGGLNGSPANTWWRVESNFAGYGMGTVSGIRNDLNGDGYGDVVVGCLFYGGGYGAVLAYFGSAAGLGDNGNLYNADWMVTPPAPADTYIGSNFSQLGGSAGDPNGDGLDDVLVSAPYYRSDPGFPNTDPGYTEGRLLAYYSHMGAVTGTVRYYGDLSPLPVIEISAHVDLDSPPTAKGWRVGGGAFAVPGLPDGSYYLYIGIDLDGSGGPPDPGEPGGLYDPDRDGTPDMVTITNLNRVTGIDLEISAWFSDHLVVVPRASK